MILQAAASYSRSDSDTRSYIRASSHDDVQFSRPIPIPLPNSDPDANRDARRAFPNGNDPADN